MKKLRIMYPQDGAAQYVACVTSLNEHIVAARYPLADSVASSESGTFLWKYAISILKNKTFLTKHNSNAGWIKKGDHHQYYSKGFYTTKQSYTREYLLVFQQYENELLVVLYTGPENCHDVLAFAKDISILSNHESESQ